MARAPRTIVNQGAASPVALLEAFRCVASADSDGEPLRWEDACSLLGAEAWPRLNIKGSGRLTAWRNAWKELSEHGFGTESDCASGVSVDATAPASRDSALWSASRKFALVLREKLDQGQGDEAERARWTRFIDATQAIEEQLTENSAPPIVLNELVQMGVIQRGSDSTLTPGTGWANHPAGIPSEWFFESLVRYFFRGSDAIDDYRLLAGLYRWWMDQIVPAPDGDGLACLRGPLTANDFVSFNSSQSERYGGLVMTTGAKVLPWLTAICQLGLAWIPLPAGRHKQPPEFGKPFPDPSALLSWGLDHILPLGREISFDEFVAAIGARYPAMDYSGQKVLPFGLSFAIRALHDDGAIELMVVRDATTRTRLANDTHKIKAAHRVRRAK